MYPGSHQEGHWWEHRVRITVLGGGRGPRRFHRAVAWFLAVEDGLAFWGGVGIIHTRIGRPRMPDSKYLCALAAIVVLLPLLASCGGKATPVGPLGDTVDLLHHLPIEVVARAPSNDEAAQHQAEVQVGEPPARVSIHWRSFNDAQHAYLLSVSFEVIESASGVELGAGVSGGPINRGTTDAAIEAIPVLITWYRRSILRTTGGSLSGEISADGTWRSD